MSKISEHEGDPGEEQIPDQSHVPARIAIGNARKDQTNTHRAGDIQQDKNSNIVSVTNEIMVEVFEHKFLNNISCFGSQVTVLDFTFDQKPDQINISRRVTQLREHGRGFSAMLRPMVDHMCHRLPQDPGKGFT
jgi:hypothetical protein